MNTRRAAELAFVSSYLMVASASAEQPTPAALLNPQWCSGVPSSPPPPNLEHRPGDWAELRKRCMNTGPDRSHLCDILCQDAKDRWKQPKAGLLNHPSSLPAIPANPAVPSSPQWCTDAPASPPPPGLEHHPGDWANLRKKCAAHDDRGCMYICSFAVELWSMKRSGRLNQPNTFRPATDKFQGPFPLPGGAKGYILPIQPNPSVPKLARPATIGAQEK
jgi:hypothetical protein